jgi:hypothetical protein
MVPHQTSPVGGAATVVEPDIAVVPEVPEVVLAPQVGVE